MPKLKLDPILDEKPVKITAELPAAIHRDLLCYADALSQQTGQTVEPSQLVGPMLARFRAADRGFAKAGRVTPDLKPRKPAHSASAAEPGSRTA